MTGICVAIAATGSCQGHFDPWDGVLVFHDEQKHSHS